MNISSALVWLLSCLGFGSPSEPIPTTFSLLDVNGGRGAPSEGNILDVLRQAGATTFLSYASRSPWIQHELGGGPSYTVFAPTNKAFEKLPRNIIDAMNSSSQVTEWYLRYHMAIGVIPLTKMRNNRLVHTSFKPPQTMDGPVQQMRFNIYTIRQEGEPVKVVTASGAPVIKTDLMASNGVVHILDKVMYPVPTGADMARALEEEPNYSSLYAALQAANLTSALSTPAFKPLTLLAPSNAAFAKLTPAQQELLKNTTILKKVLTFHVVAGSFYSAAVYENFQLHSLERSTIYFEKGAGGVFAEGQKLVNFDWTVTNGVIHELAGVMFPRHMHHLFYNEA